MNKLLGVRFRPPCPLLKEKGKIDNEQKRFWVWIWKWKRKTIEMKLPLPLQWPNLKINHFYSALHAENRSYLLISNEPKYLALAILANSKKVKAGSAKLNYHL